jgi:hypothetical protein
VILSLGTGRGAFARSRTKWLRRLFRMRAKLFGCVPVYIHIPILVFHIVQPNSLCANILCLLCPGKCPRKVRSNDAKMGKRLHRMAGLVGAVPAASVHTLWRVSHSAKAGLKYSRRAFLYSFVL